MEHVAKLANLPLSTSETETFQGQLSEVVEYIGKISKIKNQKLKISEREKTETETEKDKGEKHKIAVQREDAMRLDKCLTQEDALLGTKNKHNGLFLVPAIFEE